ncbi:MAG: metallophosphoesterase [Myxococcota bacterium]
MFLGIVTAMLGTLHGYVWFRVVHSAELGPVAVVAATIPLVLGAAAIAATLYARITRRPASPIRSTAAYVWLGLVFLAFTVSLATEPVRWALSTAGIAAGGALSLATVGAVGLLAGYGAHRGRNPVITRTTVPVRGLAPGLTGFRIVQISDLHVGDTISRPFVQRVVDAVNAQQPDLIALTGDLVDGTVDELADGVAPLAGLRARHGTFFVTGNHEYYAGAEAWIAHLTGLGLRVLRNARVRIDVGGHGFDLVGVDDLFGRMIPGHGFDLAQALAGRDPAVPAVLLSHQPVTVDAAADANVAVQLSGHTHGGQIFPFHGLVRTQQPYLAGLVVHRGTALYVHRGTGYWGPPFRIGAPSEIAVLELVPAEP